MKKDELTRLLLEAHQKGTLLPKKHDPNDLDTPRAKYRTVVTQHVSSSLPDLLTSEQFEVQHYDDARYPNGAGTFVYTPMSGSTIPGILGHSVLSGSVVPHQEMDCLLFVSGSNSSWHVMSECRQYLDTKLVGSRLTFKSKIE